MEGREGWLLDALSVAVQDGDLTAATEVMERVREAFSSERWYELLSPAPTA